MAGKFQQPILKLQKEIKRGPKNKEHGLWEFVATAADESVIVYVSDEALSALLDIPGNELDDAHLLQRIDRIEQYVANAEMQGWPSQMGVFRESDEDIGK